MFDFRNAGTGASSQELSCSLLQLPPRSVGSRFSWRSRNQPVVQRLSLSLPRPAFANTPTVTVACAPAPPTLSPTPSSSPSQPSSPTATPAPVPAASSSKTMSHALPNPLLYPWLIVGIGNPGSKFQKTRHNVGFEMIDAIAKVEDIKLNTIQQKALTGKGIIGVTPVILAKPQTYVNLTGHSVGPLAAYYRIPVQRILVVYDDMDLEFGLMRLQVKGGTTTNNGVKSVVEHLKGCRVFPRLRIGIGSAPGTMDPGAFVLQRFHELEREEMDALIAKGPVLIREVITEGIGKTASKWNEFRKSRMLLTPEEREALKRI